MAEYQALILGLQMVIKMGIKDLDVYSDSQLVINQLLKELGVKKDDLISYHKHALRPVSYTHLTLPTKRIV